MKFTLNAERVRQIYSEANPEELKTYLEAFKEVCCGSSASSPIAKLDLASRFRWLTATRSTIVQLSKVHPGFCEDPMEKLEQLHAQLVEN